MSNICRGSDKGQLCESSAWRSQSRTHDLPLREASVVTGARRPVPLLKQAMALARVEVCKPEAERERAYIARLSGLQKPVQTRKVEKPGAHRYGSHGAQTQVGNVSGYCRHLGISLTPLRPNHIRRMLEEQ